MAPAAHPQIIGTGKVAIDVLIEMSVNSGFADFPPPKSQLMDASRG
jgi:hypothetical protein